MRPCARAVCAAAVLLLATACRAPLHGPTAMDRAAFGDVAVVLVDDGVRDLEPPITGWAKGLGAGTLRGLVSIPVGAAAGAVAFTIGGAPAAGPYYPIVIAAGAAAGAAVGAVYTPISMIGGAVTTASEEEVAAAEPEVRAVLADPALAQPLADAFRAAAWTVTRRSFVEPARARTLVELRLVALRGASPGQHISFDPRVSIVAETGARVIRRADGAVLWSWTRATPASKDDVQARRYAEWGAKGGASLRAEVRRKLEALGRTYASLVFADDPAPVTAPRR